MMRGFVETIKRLWRKLKAYVSGMPVSEAKLTENDDQDQAFKAFLPRRSCRFVVSINGEEISTIKSVQLPVVRLSELLQNMKLVIKFYNPQGDTLNERLADYVQLQSPTDVKVLLIDSVYNGPHEEWVMKCLPMSLMVHELSASSNDLIISELCFSVTELFVQPHKKVHLRSVQTRNDGYHATRGNNKLLKKGW